MGTLVPLFFHDFDKFLADWKMLSPVLDTKEHEAMFEEHEKVVRQGNSVINTGATTRFEFKMCNALLNMEKTAGKEEVLAAERLFSSRFRIRKEDFVQAVLLKKRIETWK